MEVKRPQTESLRSRPHSSSVMRLTMSTKPGFTSNQRVPDLSALSYWSGHLTKCKAFKAEEAVLRTFLSRQFRTPKIALHKVKTGENLGPKWFPETEKLKLHQRETAQRFGKTTRPDTYQTIFPTAAGEYHKLPLTSSDRWEVVDMKRDQELADYGLNSSNAFKTYWMKHHSLRNRKFFNTSHKEYEDLGMNNHRRKDEIVDYRESMLGVRDMMTTLWTVKK